MTPASNPTVFLSYGRGDDEAFVRRLHDDLEAAGFDAWFDLLDMPQRPLTFIQEIEDAIRERDRLIYVGGPKARSSDYVRQEWRSALVFEKQVIPLLRMGDYEDALPGQLTVMHCEDFRDDSEYDARLQKLIENLRRPEPPLGALKNVPNLPRTFLARPHLTWRVKDALLVNLQRPLVITGAAATAEDQGDAAQRIGVQGMGGIGKSVLAAVLARDREVRRAYPDGVVWLSFGPQPDLAAHMREFAAQLECDNTFGTIAQGKGILRAFCKRKAVLVVLDDVWNARDAEAFDVLGPRCKTLVTTRDSGIVHTLQGELFSVDLLSQVEARRLLADTAGTELAKLPSEADEIARECGYLPLALALAGGMIGRRSGQMGKASDQHAWTNVLKRLRSADIEKVRDRHAINPRHESIWRAMAASVDVLEEDQRRRFIELSVFLPDQPTPQTAVATLWEHTCGQGRPRHR
jgi:NB-ARC domain/TIR domain